MNATNSGDDSDSLNVHGIEVPAAITRRAAIDKPLPAIPSTLVGFCQDKPTNSYFEYMFADASFENEHVQGRQRSRYTGLENDSDSMIGIFASA